jgi:hypothetical protein
VTAKPSMSVRTPPMTALDKIDRELRKKSEELRNAERWGNLSEVPGLEAEIDELLDQKLEAQHDLPGPVS